MDSLNGTIEVLIANAHIVWMYFPTCVSTHARHSCANGGGKGSKAILKYFHKVKTWALIMCLLKQNLLVACYVLIKVDAKVKTHYGGQKMLSQILFFKIVWLSTSTKTILK
jgi:hypothetical protein